MNIVSTPARNYIITHSITNGRLLSTVSEKNVRLCRLRSLYTIKGARLIQSLSKFRDLKLRDYVTCGGQLNTEKGITCNSIGYTNRKTSLNVHISWFKLKQLGTESLN